MANNKSLTVLRMGDGDGDDDNGGNDKNNVRDKYTCSVLSSSLWDFKPSFRLTGASGTLSR